MFFCFIYDSPTLQQLTNQFVAGVPKITGALVIGILGWLLSKFVSRSIYKFLTHLKIDRYADPLQEVEFIRKANIRISISKILSSAVYGFLLLIFLIAATDILNLPALSILISNLLAFLPNILVAIITLGIGAFAANALQKLVYTSCKSLGIPSAGIISSVLFYLVFITVVVSALSQAGINTQFIQSNISIIIGGAVFAFALSYGLASKNLITSFITSFYAKEKFKVGDKVTIGNVTGVVDSIDNTSITLVNDAVKIIIPMNRLSSEVIHVEN
ncbi:MAG: mechanosensitive ion channel [Saprospiraceae bacterium]|nr:mechanosensitive ion channel [Saprospiraceae bacterium]MBP7699757.1 mechanosensitive ion channel [Saprospiraceae bacterium]